MELVYMVNGKSKNPNKQIDIVSLAIDGKLYTVPKGYTLATAIAYAKGLSFRQTVRGDQRGPVCNMGVCFECSAYVEGKGNVRTCMIEAENGMVVNTAPDFNK